MTTFDIVTDGLIGRHRMSPGNVEKHRADFRDFLNRGVILSGVTVTVTSALSSASGAALSDDHKSATWFINTTATPEEFTATLTVTTNDNQTLVYTVDYVVG